MINDKVLVIDFDSITKHIIRDTLGKEGTASSTRI